jgi:uncharacterized protein (DUF58 family)
MKASQTFGLRITKAGAIYIGVTLLLGFAAVNTGNNLLFLLVAALLAFMSVSGVSGWQNIKGLQVSIEFPDEIYAGQETFVTVRLENRKRYLSSFLLNLTLPGSGEVSFFMLPRNGDDTDILSLSFPRRGDQEVAWAQVSSTFPVNFFVRRTGVAVNGHCVVFPRPLPCAMAEPGSGRRSGGRESSRRKGNEGDLLRISDYTGAEPIKLIHWRLSARSDGLKVKELSGPVQEPVLIDPHLLSGTTEERLSRAAWLVNRLIRDRQVPVGLRLGERVIAPGTSRQHRMRLLTELGRHDPA